MKIIAFYLPQYHAIPQNDEWWGKGFTEWTNVKKAQPLFKGHVQPKIPLNDNYYNLLNDDTKIWQAKIAREAGIDAFCYYHYWFNGELLLEKPAEQMLSNKDVDISFCFSWANEPWSRSWQGKNKNIIMDQEYGEREDWISHFNYLLPFFKDNRYIKDNNKPMFIIYKPDIIPQVVEMMSCWEEEAKKQGFNGIYWGFQFPTCFRHKEFESAFDFGIEFEPIYSRFYEQDFIDTSSNIGNCKLALKHPKLFVRNCMEKIRNIFNKPIYYDYKMTCETMRNRKPIFKNSVPGMFTSWDKTPRNGNKATVYIGSTPEAFYNYLSMKMNQFGYLYKGEYMFITAWNEWGEGAYLEPDEQYGFGYLDAIKKARDGE